MRQGKALISYELAGIFDRLGCKAQSSEVRMEKLRMGSLLDRFFATTRAKVREMAKLGPIPKVEPFSITQCVPPARAEWIGMEIRARGRRSACS